MANNGRNSYLTGGKVGIMAAKAKPQSKNVTVRRSGTRAYEIPCKVSLGLFSNEWLISVDVPDSKQLTTFVNQLNVRTEGTPTPENKVDGWVRVSLVEIDKRTNSVLVDLPQGG